MHNKNCNNVSLNLKCSLFVSTDIQNVMERKPQQIECSYDAGKFSDERGRKLGEKFRETTISK